MWDNNLKKVAYVSTHTAEFIIWLGNRGSVDGCIGNDGPWTNICPEVLQFLYFPKYLGWSVYVEKETYGSLSILHLKLSTK